MVDGTTRQSLLMQWLPEPREAGFLERLESAADAAGPHGATLWPRLELHVKVTQRGDVSYTPAASFADWRPALEPVCSRVVCLDQPSSPSGPLWPNLEALMRDQGPSPAAVISALGVGTTSTAALSIRRWLEESPWRFPASMGRRSDGARRMCLRTNPVRAGRGGAAIWQQAALEAGAFRPLALRVSIGRGARDPAVDFTISPHVPGRRPLAAVGPYDLFHGDTRGQSQTFLMRAAQAVSRASLSVQHLPWQLREAVRREVETTRGVCLRAEPTWELAEEGERRAG
jgi:hypothetical protein